MALPPEPGSFRQRSAAEPVPLNPPNVAGVQTIRASDPLRGALSDLGECLVFEAVNVSDEWEDVQSELEDAFTASAQAATEEVPVVYLVSSDALLGRTGVGNAMVATALLSGARTLALELRKAGVPVNVIGTSSDTDVGEVAHWVRQLLTRSGGPTGELIQLGGTQIGKALP